MKYLLLLVFISTFFYLPAQHTTLKPDEHNGVLLVNVTDYKNQIRVGEEISFTASRAKRHFREFRMGKEILRSSCPKGTLIGS